jgi:hypothetical protein
MDRIYNQIWLSCSCCLLIIFCTSNTFGQDQLILQKQTGIDQLKILVNYPENFDDEKRLKYQSHLKEAISKSNNRFSFQIYTNTSEARYELILDMSAIHYPARKDDMQATLGNIIFFGGQATLAATLGFCLPVLILFYPDTSSDVKMKFTDHNAGYTLEIENTITSNAYFASVKRQDQRFEKAFKKTIFKTLKKLHQQSKKNIKKYERNHKV